MRARLVTWPDPQGDRHPIGLVDLPAFVKVPDVIQWGVRTFARDPGLGDLSAPAGVYVEAFCYTVADPSAVVLDRGDPARAEQRDVVHALRGGLALCGQPGVPGTWPRGHTWVYADHVDDLPDVSCMRCRGRLGP